MTRSSATAAFGPGMKGKEPPAAGRQLRGDEKEMFKKKKKKSKCVFFSLISLLNV